MKLFGGRGGRGRGGRGVIERRAVVFKCLTYSTFDDVTYDVILPLGWAGSNESHIYPNMCAKFGCGPTVVSKRGGGVQTDRQTGRQTDKDSCSFI